MKGRPRDERLARIDDVAYRVALDTLRALEEARVPYVLVGGWAVAAHGSRVPSIDTDVLLARAERERALAAVAQSGGAAAPERLELLDMDGLNVILGTDTELGEPERGYVPARLLEDRTTRRRLILRQGALDVTVPEAPELAFMKLKAYHDRELAWRALREPAVMATIPTFDRPGVRAKTPGHFRVKAGKDLYDLAYLLAGPCTLREVEAIATRFELQEPLLRPLRDVPWPLLELALDLARDTPAAEGWLRGLPQAG